MDPLTRMLSEAMSKARVSEVSGVPSQHQDQQSSAKNVITHSSSSAQHEIKPMATGGTAGHSEESLDKNEIPSFLLAIISKDESKPSKFLDASLSSPKPKSQDIGKDSTQSSLLSSLTGTGKKSPTLDRNAIRQSGPPLSAELLPASVMPNGLYSNTTKMSTGGQAGHQQLSSSHPSPGAITTTTMLNRPNGVMSHPSPLQGPTFAYSPGMMPSPLVMPPMQGGPMMRPPPPPPLSFQHHPGHPMGIPPPPPPQAALNFPADAMHAAMGAVGFMQQQQRGFMGQESEVLSKAEFTQQFLGLLQNDPQFMDVLYSNYTAVLARRG
ncbi:hypothetical protein BCR41DRAFT_346064 [Lobosporangium transversale]|uniref:Uncharacterized protein n=1 Tax=Lobosporangium transversale TaxID=64571 RepID=A0A1Y2GZU2_9FUNG|nr:hypothetical protein BCR41DRAFT_346064 [Lobosporangium transversale]ORZ27828.1 hypothetical protein BCR41DRAFT_346064 [Lobosporangium transversale]|eukprot:XP_021885531.1 hypothetical protein BCR41DRAFT_346064 [Lobosporangium transversale]